MNIFAELNEFNSIADEKAPNAEDAGWVEGAEGDAIAQHAASRVEASESLEPEAMERLEIFWKRRRSECWSCRRGMIKSSRENKKGNVNEKGI